MKNANAEGRIRWRGKREKGDKLKSETEKD